MYFFIMDLEHPLSSVRLFFTVAYIGPPSHNIEISKRSKFKPSQGGKWSEV